MADHFSGPRALADPASDITDVFVFPSPERPGYLVLVLDVFPIAGPTALFSDALSYRFHLRPVRAATAGGHRRSWPVTTSGRSTSDSLLRPPARQCRPAHVPRPAEQRFRSGSATASRPTPLGCGSLPGSGGSLLPRPRRRVGQPRAGTADVPYPGHQHRGRRELPEHRRRTRHRHRARPRHGPLLAVVGETLTSRSPGPAGTHGPAGDQELPPAGQEVRSCQPRPGNPRHLQRRGRLQPQPELRRGLPRPAERQPSLFRPAGREDRLAAATSRATTRYPSCCWPTTSSSTPPSRSPTTASWRSSAPCSPAARTPPAAAGR